MDRSKNFAATLASKNWLVFPLLALAGLAAYGTSLHGKFLYDDTWLVGGNPFFKSPVFIFEVFRHFLFLDSLSFYYRPVQNISYMFDYWLSYTDPFGYHLANVFYHVLAGFLLYLLLKALLPGLTRPSDARESGHGAQADTLIAFLVALAWVVHPIHNAAVAYVSGRADSLACDFAISAWLLYLCATHRRATWTKIALQALAMFFFLMGLCSKEIAMVWLPLFAFHLFVFNREKSLPQKFGAVFGILLVMCCYHFLHNLPGVSPLPGGPGTPPFGRRLVLMLRALGDYTWLIFYPSNLHMDRYVLPTGDSISLFHWDLRNRLEYLSTIGLAMIAVFLLMGKSGLPGQRLRLFAIGWFLSGFLPISNLFPLNAQVAEHWIYMPSMGLLLFFAGCVLAMPRQWQVAAAVVALVAVVPLTLLTRARAYEWADPERFFMATIASGGGSDRINLNLAMIYYNRGDYAKAENMMRNIVNHDPAYVPARIDLGTTLLKEHKDKEAAEILKFDEQATARISKEYVHTWTAAISVANMQLQQKNYDQALAMADAALKQYPGVWEVIQFKANVLQAMGRVPDAIADLKAFTDAHWWHYSSFINLGQLYRLNGDAPDAIAAYQHAAVLDIHTAEPYFRIAEIDDNLLQKPDAAQEARVTGIARNPDIFKTLESLDQKKDALEAVEHAEQHHGGELLPVGGN